MIDLKFDIVNQTGIAQFCSGQYHQMLVLHACFVECVSWTNAHIIDLPAMVIKPLCRRLF